MASHTHNFLKTEEYATDDKPPNVASTKLMGSSVADGNVASLAGTDELESRTYLSSTGSGNAHNNIQPYQTAYMWERTA